MHHFIDKTYLGWFADVKRTAETIECFSKKTRQLFLILDALATGGQKYCLPGNLRGAGSD